MPDVPSSFQRVCCSPFITSSPLRLSSRDCPSPTHGCFEDSKNSSETRLFVGQPKLYLFPTKGLSSPHSESYKEQRGDIRDRKLVVYTSEVRKIFLIPGFVTNQVGHLENTLEFQILWRLNENNHAHLRGRVRNKIIYGKQVAAKHIGPQSVFALLVAIIIADVLVRRSTVSAGNAGACGYVAQVSLGLAFVVPWRSGWGFTLAGHLTDRNTRQSCNRPDMVELGFKPRASELRSVLDLPPSVFATAFQDIIPSHILPQPTDPFIITYFLIPIVCEVSLYYAIIICYVISLSTKCCTPGGQEFLMHLYILRLIPNLSSPL